MMSEIKRDEIVSKVNQTIDNVLSFSSAINQPDKWNRTIDNVFALSNRAQKSWDTVDQTLNQLYGAAHNAEAFTEKANEIINYTSQGKGTVGQLFMGNELFLRLKSILHKGEVVMNDMNHYGLLYHLDKRWQRLQGERLRYFNQEMDQISSSLSRVSLVLNDSECYPQSLISNPQFTHRFSELLRRVETMEETLKIYNEQVVSQDNCQ